MTIINPDNTPEYLWYELVDHAQTRAGYSLDDGLSSYLVLTLKHFSDYNQLSSDIVAIELLENLQISDSTIGRQGLRKVGDQCLIISGLFPERLDKLNVSFAYYITAGKNAYWHVAQNAQNSTLDEGLFCQLSDEFVGLVDVLHHVRQAH
jgi:hypothetical protein